MRKNLKHELREHLLVIKYILFYFIFHCVSQKVICFEKQSNLETNRYDFSNQMQHFKWDAYKANLTQVSFNRQYSLINNLFQTHASHLNTRNYCKIR